MTTRPHTDPFTLARELTAAYALQRTDIAPPSSRDSYFDLDVAYAVQAEVARARRADGRTTVGWKVGYANKAVWRALKLDTLTWAHMYADTVQYAAGEATSLSASGLCSPKIEPEVVVKLNAPVESTDPAIVLESVEWLALGFEIIDCVYTDWKFQPADFVAAFGLHAMLIVGDPHSVRRADIPGLTDQLGQFKLQLRRNGRLVEEGSGKNALRSPALVVAELAAAMARRPDGEQLKPGDLISTGTLTTSRPIEAGQRWQAIADGIDLPALTLNITPR
jgi:2-oxo-3-hexenedioate decarboxylase